MIPYSRQSINKDDIDSVVRVLSAEFLTQGPAVEEFEVAIAGYVGTNYAVAMNSATSALHAACLALGVGPGDQVWTSAISFVASANAGRYCGAEIDFVDIDPDTFNMDPRALSDKLIATRLAGKQLPKVVVPVAMCGQSADMLEIWKLASDYGFFVLEDASHALGADYKGAKVGSCVFSHISVFSFHPVKMITTGEGGACVTNDATLARKIKRLRSHGISRDACELTLGDKGSWYYEQQDLGYNYRMTDFQAALGESQIRRLDSFVQKRNQIAERYRGVLNLDWLTLPEIRDDRNSSFHLFVARINANSEISRDQLFKNLRSKQILVNFHYIPIYRHPYYSRMGIYDPDCFPQAEKYYETAISLPLFPDMTDLDVQVVTLALEGYNKEPDHVEFQ